MKDLILIASRFAEGAHEGQVRKYTGEPYIEHPRRVAHLVTEAADHTDYMVAAALLHDVVEDCGVKLSIIVHVFGPVVGDYVNWLTNVSKPEDGNRVRRKAMDRDQLAAAPWPVHTIKVCDLIDNSESIIKHDRDFARVYLREKRQLLDVLIQADARLWQRAHDIVVAAEITLTTT